MNNTSQPDDDWAELARELDRVAPANRAPEPPPSSDDGDEFAEPSVPEGVAAGEEFEDGDEIAEGEAGNEAEGQPGEGQPGMGRKRRRRRRRRRKGGQPAEIAEVPEAETAPEVSDGDSEPEIESEPEPAETDSEDDTFPTGADLEEAEDAGGELLRELIANWNVPSWDEIVSSLHRPVDR